MPSVFPEAATRLAFPEGARISQRALASHCGSFSLRNIAL